MSEERSKRIGQRAYEIWEREGRPTGRDMEHWYHAEAEIAREEAEQAKKEAEQALNVAAEALEKAAKARGGEVQDRCEKASRKAKSAKRPLGEFRRKRRSQEKGKNSGIKEEVMFAVFPLRPNNELFNTLLRKSPSTG